MSHHPELKVPVTSLEHLNRVASQNSEKNWNDPQHFSTERLELPNPDILKLHDPEAMLQGDRPARMRAVLSVCCSHAVENHRQLAAAGGDVKRIPFSAR